MKVIDPPSNILLLRAETGEALLPGLDFVHRVVGSSARSNWNHLVVEELNVPINELDGVMFVQHVAVVNVGQPVTFEVTKDGRRQCILDTGSTSVFPSHQPFFSRRKRGESGFAHVILVGLDPVFVGQTRRRWNSIPMMLNWLSGEARLILSSGTL